jgi:hypothetical protein
VVATEFTGDDTRRVQPRGQCGFGVVSRHREMDRRPPTGRRPMGGTRLPPLGRAQIRGGGLTVAIR